MLLRYVQTLFILLVPHLFSNFAPPSAKKRPYKQTKNQWGTLGWKNIFFQKCSPIFLKHVSNDCICCADSKNIHNMGSKHLIVPVHALRALNPIICMFLETAKQMQLFGSHLKKIGEHFCEKVFFHPRVLPLVFGLSVRSFFGWGRGIFLATKERQGIRAIHILRQTDLGWGAKVWHIVRGRNMTNYVVGQWPEGGLFQARNKQNVDKKYKVPNNDKKIM